MTSRNNSQGPSKDQKKSKASQNPTTKKPGVVSKQDSLTKLSAIIANEKDTTIKRLTKAVSDRIEGLKKAS